MVATFRDDFRRKKDKASFFYVYFLSTLSSGSQLDLQLEIWMALSSIDHLGENWKPQLQMNRHLSFYNYHPYMLDFLSLSIF